MNKEKAIVLAQQWSQGAVCSLQEREMEEYHKLFLDMLLQSNTEKSNIPLTYDELRQYCHVCESQFEVRPLYIVCDKINAPHIIIHGWRGVKDVRFAYDNYGSEYGKTWWAYHNEPEKGDKHEL